jgi:integrase
MTRHGARGTRVHGCLPRPRRAHTLGGSFSTRREALRAANREEQKVLAGAWHDNTQGEITFRDYVEKEWLPNKHVEASTRAAYISYLDKHFFPFFGDSRLNRISPSLVQDWVTQAKADGLAPRSIRKYHVLLSSVFVRAVKDRVLVYNPCDHTELPKVIAAKARTLTPVEYERLLTALPVEHRLMIETLIGAGLRWGELVALKPRHIDFLRRTLSVEETIVEVSKKHSPTGQRYLAKPYPKDNEPRTFGVRQAWLDAIAAHIKVNSIKHDDLLFPTRAGTPISRNTFRTRIWLPAVKASGVDFPVRVHDLRHAHASWLLAGGADLMSVMERMGHSQIQTTQKYLHTLPDTDQRNLDALTRIQTTQP